MKYTDANELGFLPGNTGVENCIALQNAVDKTGTIYISKPGEYKLAGTVYLSSFTTLKFGNGVFIKKVWEKGSFSYVFLNRGTLARTFDEHIRIENLYLIVNEMDSTDFEIFGLRGQVSFHYVKDLVIEGFRCMDLGASQFAIHICTFEDIIVRDLIIKGDKDGVHLGKGKRFYIGNGVFETFDDAIALNAQDYDKCNPELGWIEDGIIENCHDLDDKKDRKVGFFCRALSGGWLDWFEGIEVQKSDAVVSNGRIYRVNADADGKRYISTTKPVHKKGEKTIDGISWVMIQEDTVYSVGVRNVIFRNIFLHKPRICFAPVFENNRFNRSYYEGAQLPIQGNIVMENIHVLHDKQIPFMEITSPVDYMAIHNSRLANTKLQFFYCCEFKDIKGTDIHISGCVSNGKNIEDVIENNTKDKVVHLHSSANVFIDSKKNN